MSYTAVKNENWDENTFFQIRHEVLEKWPTMEETDLSEAIAYHSSMPKKKNLFSLIDEAVRNRDTLVNPRGGVALLEDQITLLLHLQDQGGADWLPTTADSYTRNEKFLDAQTGIEKSIKSGRSMLNGFPVVNHGVKNCRQIIEAVEVPVMLLPGTPFPATAAEIAFASGYTGLLGGGISDTIRFTKRLSIADGIKNYQYVDRLVSYYDERGIGIHRQHTGFLTGTLVPPGMAIAIIVLDCLLAAEQGVKQYGLGIGQNMNIVQDVAALRILPKVCKAYLRKAGHEQMAVLSGSHQWMGAFPQDEAEAFSVICLGAVIGVLGNATYITTKTTHEAVGIPTKESNAAGVRATKKIVKHMRHFNFPVGSQVGEEMEIIKTEAESILNKVLEMGDGDPAIGAVRGFEAGVLDVPWAPSIYVAGKVMPALDCTGAVRYLDPGDLPLSREIKEFHRARLNERARKENVEVGLEMAIQDVTEIARSIIADQ